MFRLKNILTSPVIRIADYRKIWISSLFNMMGFAGEQVIVGFLIYDLTGSTAWVGASLALAFGPMLLFGAPAGVLADRMERRKLLPACEFSIALLLGSYATLVYFSGIDLWLILTVAFVSGSLRAIHAPIRTSYVYDLVGTDNIVSSLGLLNLGIRTGQLIGASLAGLAIKFYGPVLAFTILCIGHCFSLVILLNLSNAGRSADFKPSSLADQFGEFGKELITNRSLQLIILITAAIEIFGFSFATALPEIAKVKLGVDASGLGFMHTARAIGGMIAGIAFASALNLPNKGRIYIGVTFGFGAAVAGLGLSPNFSVAVIAIAIIAAMAASTDVLSQSMMQMVVPDHLRGRAMGAWVFAVGIAPVGHIEAGILSELVGADIAMIINGTALMITTACVMLIAPGKLKSL